jgi:hypothetical protein
MSAEPLAQKENFVAKALQQPPFPKLTWDEPYWRGPLRLSWYTTSEPPELVLSTGEMKPTKPTETQATAYERLLADGAAWQALLLAPFRQYVPELAHAKWAELEAFFQLNTVRLFEVDRDGLAYVGLVFHCLQWDYGYEHGVGIVLHDQRIVCFGMAEQAENATEAMIDLGLLPRAEEEDE